VAERKREIKEVGDQIDRDLNKSLMRAAKQSTVSIRDIFSAPKSSSKRINELNEELRTVRAAIRRVKADIQKLCEGMTDPVSLLNQEKGIDFEARIKSAETRIRQAEGEKEMLTEEISRASL
jgi:predicted  nucleic acid-binding Zn-ribbon protein